MTALPGDKLSGWQAICRNSSEDALIKIVGSNFPLHAVYAAQAELIRRGEPLTCTNLYQWRKELAEGKRDAYTFDELWRLACKEMAQSELDAVFRRRPAPQPSTASDDLPF